jgi:hypothetical protein
MSGAADIFAILIYSAEVHTFSRAYSATREDSLSVFFLLQPPLFLRRTSYGRYLLHVSSILLFAKVS